MNHPETNRNELCVGNCTKMPEYLSSLKTARLGKQAYDIHYQAIPRDQMRPLILDRSELADYDAIMMRRFRAIR